ncbi:MAG: hypothetical protein IPN50_14265 [Sphingomonadales bacterium]|nr:hypothetical protein [Sphingomonadales bacterium]
MGDAFSIIRLDDAIANVTLGQGPGNFSSVGFSLLQAEPTGNDKIWIPSVSKGFEFDGSIDLRD